MAAGDREWPPCEFYAGATARRRGPSWRMVRGSCRPEEACQSDVDSSRRAGCASGHRARRGSGGGTTAAIRQGIAAAHRRNGPLSRIRGNQHRYRGPVGLSGPCRALGRARGRQPSGRRIPAPRVRRLRCRHGWMDRGGMVAFRGTLRGTLVYRIHRTVAVHARARPDPGSPAHGRGAKAVGGDLWRGDGSRTIRGEPRGCRRGGSRAIPPPSFVCRGARLGDTAFRPERAVVVRFPAIA